ncbi:glycosyltransferase [Mucilaginibacter robiniae]|uniref:Glycosyltransferase n=1 Tax=Mucilaginibacter robiniae TaxID=2728022 RepID=A0A7L5DWG0_9SPHI|nr:glycosyltransferase [Mucilaginibacter robiniae]QJD94407.1 glycosyltransferase [Mucilaginibacter robiniae]
MNLAPVLVFTYKRLEPLKQSIEALKKNVLAKESNLYIFSDGAKNDSDREQVKSVREFLKDVSGFKSITIKEAEVNKGLANSIIQGVTEVLENHNEVIVLEDDLLTTPNFLTFMNQALNKYRNSASVFSISGYSFDLGECTYENSDAYFLERGWSWGWATWKNKWSDVDWKVKDYDSFRRDKRRQRAFAKGGSDLNKMLRNQMNGLLDSWAIRWFYYQYKVKGLTLYPVRSKVYNNGFDNSATHTNGSDRRYRPLLDTEHSLEFQLPDAVAIHPYYHEKFSLKMGLRARIISKVETLILKVKNSL